MRNLAAGRDSTRRQLSRIRRLFLGGGGASDSDDVFSDGSLSSADDEIFNNMAKE